MLVLDSNVLLWWLEAADRIRPELMSQINEEPEVAVSVVSPWELWIKVATGKLTTPDGLIQQLALRRILVLSPTLEDARLAANLPPLHRDPFDRMIVAQVMNRQATLVTADRLLGDYGIRTILT